MWFFVFASTHAHALEWQSITHNQDILSDAEEGMGCVDIVGPLQWALEDTDLYIRFSVASAEYTTQTQWRILFKEQNTGSISGFVITPEEIMLADFATHFTGLNNIRYPIATEEYSSRVQLPTEENLALMVTLPLWAFPVDHLKALSFTIFNVDGQSQDLLGQDGSINPVLWGDPLTFDVDGDGLPEDVEAEFQSDPNDADSDDDGLPDGMEWYLGTDPLLCDTDGDGLFDGLEAGIPNATSDTDLSMGCFVADTDPSSQTSPLLVDTDGGGVSDFEEDRNHNGAFDPWESDPNNPLDDIDSDGDGIPDSLEAECAQGLSEDADGDGALDTFEGFDDADEDGIPNFCDEDDDNDGISSAEEGFEDIDNDELPNAYDIDADGDEIPDSEERNWDVDCDDIAEFLDANPDDGPCSDSDGDGLLNDEEDACGTDPFDPDSDDDGILDSEEECGGNTDPAEITIPTVHYDEEDTPKTGCTHTPLHSLFLFLFGLFIRRR